MFEGIFDVYLKLNCDRSKTLVCKSMYDGIISSQIFEELGLEVREIFATLFLTKYFAYL